MTDAGAAPAGAWMKADLSDHAVAVQVGGDYAEHIYQYVHGWDTLRGQRLGKEEFDLAEDVYVEPASDAGAGIAAEAAAVLSRGQHRVLVLLGDGGTGRRTATVRILRRLGVPRDKVLSLVLDWDRPRIEQVPSTKDHGFILDLTRYGSLPEDFYTGLGDFQREARASQAYLIILATVGTWQPGSLASVPSMALGRPAPREVALAHVRHYRAERVGWLESEELRELPGSAAPPGDAARLADIVIHTRGDTGDVKEEFENWNQRLLDWFADNDQAEDLRERALLIASAMLDRVPAEIVMKAADMLFAKVEGTLPTGGALAGRDLDKRLETIGAKKVDDSISLNAKRHGYAEATLRHVWRQRPPLRPLLLEWASDISAPRGIAVNCLPQIAAALTRLALQPGGATVLSVVSTWIETGSERHRRLAVGLLENMALHPVLGVGIRKQLYDWAQQKGTSEALATAVAEVCSGQLGRMYPRVALTRLRLLASRTDGKAQSALERAVRALAADTERRPLLLAEIAEWAESSEETVRHAGATAFLTLTDLSGEDPLALELARELADAPVDALKDQLFVRGWRAAWQHHETGLRAQQTLAAWLDSLRIPEEHALAIAAAVVAGRLGDAGVADLLVGSAVSTETGRARRRILYEQLIPDPDLAVAPASAGDENDAAVSGPA